MLLELTAYMSKNYLWYQWTFFSSIVLTFGILILNWSEWIPLTFHRIVKYGKSANVESYSKWKHIWNLIEIPKRFFYHFYFFALILYIFLALAASVVYFSDGTPTANKITITKIIKLLLNTVSTSGKATVTPESVMIGIVLLIFQVSRRLFECTMLSVYSDAKMNVIHYFFGYAFYFGVGMSILAEAPAFSNSGSMPVWLAPSKYDFFTLCHVIGICLFAWSSYLQFDSHRILANLRKNARGEVVSHSHSIPRGKWFDLVSCPHYMAEILIYLSISIVMSGRSSTWWMVFIFVVINQLMVGKFNHSWYLNKFEDYPKTRQAVIPYIY